MTIRLQMIMTMLQDKHWKFLITKCVNSGCYTGVDYPTTNDDTVKSCIPRGDHDSGALMP